LQSTVSTRVGDFEPIAIESADRLGFAVKCGPRRLKERAQPRCRITRRRVQPGLTCRHLRVSPRPGTLSLRMSSELAPYLTHPDLPSSIARSRNAAPNLVRSAHRRGRPVSAVVSPFTVRLLNAPDRPWPRAACSSSTTLVEMLDRHGWGPEAVIVGPPSAASMKTSKPRAAFRSTPRTLPEGSPPPAALEHHGHARASHTLWISQPHRVKYLRQPAPSQHNAQRLSMREALGCCLATWPVGCAPRCIQLAVARRCALRAVDPQTGPAAFNTQPRCGSPFRLHSSFRVRRLRAPPRRIARLRCMLEARARTGAAAPTADLARLPPI